MKELKVCKVRNKNAFRIVKQSHFGDDFGSNCELPWHFAASDGLHLISNATISADVDTTTLAEFDLFFVCGSKLLRKREFACTEADFSRIKQAVHEYNEWGKTQ